MPASLPVSEHSEASVKSAEKVPMQTFSPDISWPDDSVSNEQAAGIPNIEATNSAYRNNFNPRAQWPRQVRQNSRWDTSAACTTRDRMVLYLITYRAQP